MFQRMSLLQLEKEADRETHTKDMTNKEKLEVWLLIALAIFLHQFDHVINSQNGNGCLCRKLVTQQSSFKV